MCAVPRPPGSVASPDAVGRHDRLQTLHGLFEQQAALTPGAPALASADGEMSYAETNAAANRLARGLRSVGVTQETRVVVFLERSPAMVVAQLAVLKAGGAFVPIDPAYPADRVALVVEDSAAAVVLTESGLLDRVPPTAATVVCLDREEPTLEAESSEDLAEAVSPLNLAYVIYTSGSTGRPKGVAVPHAGIPTVARELRSLFRPGPGDVVLLFAALGFDTAVWEVTMALTTGATLYVPTETRRRWRLRNLLEESRATIVTLPPAALATLPTSLELPELRDLVVGGEACPATLARAWCGGRGFWNSYGPTEITMSATCALIEHVPEDAVRVPIGRATEGRLLHVLDGGLEPVDEGELYIGGAGVARGYLFQPSLTATRFLPDPFSPVPGARMYRSGDVVRRIAGGELEFLGRVDDQVQVSGFRIEPAEIEAALDRCDGVRSSAVVAVGEGDARRLVAFVVGEPRRPEELRDLLATTLPPHMLPSQYVHLDALPETPNGKVDRRALRALAGDDAAPPAPVADGAEDVAYRVVVNDEDQYSVWPAGRSLPSGWSPVGRPDSLEHCLEVVDELWTDLRPRSLRAGGRQELSGSPAAT
jgi:amino acid adenylation domain-containing protein